MSDPNTYDDLKAAVVSTGNRCCAEGLQTGTGGNISCRVPGEDLMVVKASGTSFADTDLDAAVVADFRSNLVGPGRKPSKESPLHGAIYAAMPDVGAIVHVHSPWANAWCVDHDSLPAITYHAAAKLGGDLAVVDTGVSTVPDEFIPAVLRALQDPPRPVMVLRKHGLVAIGKTVDDARQMAELVEETAHVAVMSALLSNTAG